MSGDLADLHLADLHARAAEAGIDGYRMLGRDELIERLAGGGEGDGDRPKRKRGRRGGRRSRDRERLTDGDSPRRDRAPRSGGGREEREDPDGDEGGSDETEDVSGILEITRQRHGFLRVEGSDDDVYVSASQVRRCELRAGDEVAGPARAPRRGERHRALVHVDTVNGSPPQEEGRREFESLTPAAPGRRIPLGEDASVLARAVDLLAPLAFGQRVLVRAEPRSGRTTLLRELAIAIAGGSDEVRPIVVLIDERPEEVPAWQEALPGADLALAPADLAPRRQVREAMQGLERALRAAEAGADVVLICDSLSRLAVAAGGVAEAKRLFGSGRETAEDDAGSLTVIATVFSEGDDEQSADRAVTTTETSLVALDRSLADAGIVPALNFGECRAVGEDKLLAADELETLRTLRGDLAALEPSEAAALLREKLS